MAQTIKQVNLEQGMPTWEQAERKLLGEITLAKKTGIRVLKIIHGYGSTGVGGKLRVETRKLLVERKRRSLIKDFVPGEEWSKYLPTTKDLLNRYPKLKNDSDLNHQNEGITIVII